MANNHGYIGRSPGDAAVIIARQNYTSSGVTTDFTFTSGYTPGYLDVYLNGVRLVNVTDYTAGDGSTVGLTSAAVDGDALELVAYKAFNVGNVTNATGNFDVGQKLTVSGISSLTDVVSSGIVTADSFYGDGSNLTGILPSATAVPGINTAGFSTFKQAAFSGVTTVTDTTASTSTSTGGLIVSGGVGIAKSLFVGEGISVGGTITYDDVTNIDSVGIVTAGKGFRATTGGIQITAGVGTFKGDVQLHGNQGVTSITFDSSANTLQFQDDSYIKMGTGSDFHIYHDASNSYIVNTTGELRIDPKSGERGITLEADGSVNLYYDNSAKIETISTGASVYGGLRLTGGGLMREALKIDSTALNSGSTINLSDGMIHYRSSAVGGANVKLNVISNAGINTDMAIGDVMTVTVITVAGSTSHFVDQIRIDGVEATAGVTTNWSGGSVPSDGGGSGIDSYSFNIMKTANATYVVLANQTKTS